MPSVWTMRHKQDLTTNQVTTHNASLNLHGAKEYYGMNYFETYALVVTWLLIQSAILIAILLSWSFRKVDFIMAYMQAPILMDGYLEVPMGIEAKHGNIKSHVLKLLSNLYGQKKAGHVWNQYLIDNLLTICFTQLLINECEFYSDNVIFTVYIDDRLFCGPPEHKLTLMIQALKQSGSKSNLTNLWKWSSSSE